MGAYKRINTAGKTVWYFRDRGVHLPDGTTTEVSGRPTVNSKQAAEEAERIEILRVQGKLAAEPLVSKTPSPGDPNEPTIETLAKYVIDEYKLDGKPRSRRDRARYLRSSVIPFFGTMRPSQLDQSHVEAFVATRIKRGNVARTINKHLVALSVLLQYAVECKRIAVLPSVTLWRKVPKRKNKVRPYSRDEVDALLKHARHDARYRAAILLGSDAGFRIGEIRALQWGAIDWKAGKRGTITIRLSLDDKNNLTGTKNENDRVIPLSRALRAALKDLPKRGIWCITRLNDEELRAAGPDRKFASEVGGFIGYSTLRKAMNQIAKKAGCYGGGRHTWHSLRHTFGTELGRAGVPVKRIQRLMDHEDIETTMQYITMDDQAGDQAAIAAAFD